MESSSRFRPVTLSFSWFSWTFNSLCNKIMIEKTTFYFFKNSRIILPGFSLDYLMRRSHYYSSSYYQGQLLRDFIESTSRLWFSLKLDARIIKSNRQTRKKVLPVYNLLRCSCSPSPITWLWFPCFNSTVGYITVRNTLKN